MIGTSDGEQYEDSFAHTLATLPSGARSEAPTMPPGASGQPAGELKTDLGTQVAPKQALSQEAENLTSSSKYDQLPTSKNIDDRRNEINDIAIKAKSLDELLEKLSNMVKEEDPEDAKKYYKEMIKEEDITDPLARKAGILDLINQIKTMQNTK